MKVHAELGRGKCATNLCGTPIPKAGQGHGAVLHGVDWPWRPSLDDVTCLRCRASMRVIQQRITSVLDRVPA